jgi:hypothetical protein
MTEKPYAFLLVSFAFAFSPSTIPAEICPRSPEPVQNQRAMAAQHAGHLFHRVDPGTHHLDTPLVEERARPLDRSVLREELETLPKQEGPHGAQIMTQQVPQSGALVACLVLTALQENPSRFGRMGWHPCCFSARTSVRRTWSIA